MFNNNLIGILAIAITSSIGFLFFWFWKSKIWNKNSKPNFLSFIENKKPLQYSLVTLVLLLLFYLDFIRDYIFKNLTFRMQYIELIEKGGSPDKYLDPTDSFMVSILEGLSAYQIYYGKFLATFCMLFIYFIVCQLILKLAYIKHRTLKFTSLLHGTGVILMMFVFSFYFFTFPPEIKNNFYLISMEIGHFLESSLPTLLLLLSFKIYLSSQNINQIE
jgi:hypothetical protein